MITIDVADKLGNYDLEAVHYSRPDASADEADLEHVVVQLRAQIYRGWATAEFLVSETLKWNPGFKILNPEPGPVNFQTEPETRVSESINF